jgi:hypothetical protein
MLEQGTSSMTVVGDIPHVVDVQEEVVVGEGVVGIRDEASSRAKALLKNHIALHPYMTQSSAVLEAYCPDQQCTL